MSRLKGWMLLSAFTIGLCSSGLALADRGHFHGNVGVYVGPGFGPGWGPGWGPGFGPGWGPRYPRPYYYDPYYYGYAPPPVIIAPAPQPPVYIEQTPSVDNPQLQAPPPQSAAPAQDNYWYHCAKPEGYYPYVKECAQGWQRVAPQPPAQ